MTHAEFRTRLSAEVRFWLVVARWLRYVSLVLAIARLIYRAVIPVAVRQRTPLWIWLRWQILCGRATRRVGLGDQEVLVGRHWVKDPEHWMWRGQGGPGRYLRLWCFEQDLKERAQWIRLYAPVIRAERVDPPGTVGEIMRARREPMLVLTAAQAEGKWFGTLAAIKAEMKA
jgi:hypothetical protein